MFLMDVLSSSTKEINRLISKGMCAILFDVFNECSLTFTTEKIEKNWPSQNFFDFRFSQKENLEKSTSFEEQKGTR